MIIHVPIIFDVVNQNLGRKGNQKNRKTLILVQSMPDIFHIVSIEEMNFPNNPSGIIDLYTTSIIQSIGLPSCHWYDYHSITQIANSLQCPQVITRISGLTLRLPNRYCVGLDCLCISCMNHLFNPVSRWQSTWCDGEMLLYQHVQIERNIVVIVQFAFQTFPNSILDNFILGLEQSDFHHWFMLESKSLIPSVVVFFHPNNPLRPGIRAICLDNSRALHFVSSIQLGFHFSFLGFLELYLYYAQNSIKLLRVTTSSYDFFPVNAINAVNIAVCDRTGIVKG